MESYPDFQAAYELLSEQGSMSLLRGDFAGYADAARQLACKANRIPAGEVELPKAQDCTRWPRVPGIWLACAGADYSLLEEAAKGGATRAVELLFAARMLNEGQIGEPFSHDRLNPAAVEIVGNFKDKSPQARLESLLLAGGKKCYEAAEKEKDNPDMQALLGVCHLNGWGVKASETRAWQLFAAAEKESPFAQFCLGVCCENAGVGNAEKWYHLAASNGCWKAVAVLQSRSPHAKDAQKRWFEICRQYAESGHADAQKILGRLYANGLGVEKDAAKAAKWAGKVAGQGDAREQFKLGRMYEEGDGVAQDAAKAAEWYRKAAEQDHADAQFKLGKMYEDGRGVPQDDAKALAWYFKAAGHGHAKAQNSVGLMYENGRGVAQDYAKAVEWYRKAAAQGHDNARASLQRLGKS